ncbi:uncharacterized protein K452DRAFT_268677 [Aplosporella prunicola CBS 121167]|uniref:Domain of unknown function at the cortex 1 domain-containing protein n=1 Tax=Aplosporella prunicola CBS 121167 TaxID=1176127 RepID=A0A6A6BH30_9PEZI|nr:uncharacterized protein K452DRAFT_268677 [Aplosporella prunicola CBS 121167]KAF2143286.1 hypothetical protein K452DRAFT_268677 [Aplosporella prunicola CBS 121167]
MASKVKRAVRKRLSRGSKAATAVSDATSENISNDKAASRAYDEEQGAGRPRNPRRTVSPSKYKLRVTAGPSYDVSTHRIVDVNARDALAFENQHMRVNIKVRVRDYEGLPLSAPASSAYFADPVHEKDRYSIAFSFVPKADIQGTHCVWGPNFEHPVRDRLPPGFNYAFGIVKRWIDPGIECDAYADKPWLYAPALSCWFVLRVGQKISAHHNVPEVDEHPVLAEGADGDGAAVRSRLGLPAESEKRRKHFLDATNRDKFVFERGRLYQGDFFNPYLDFNKFALRLPGFSLGVLKYVDDKTHTLRWVFKNASTGDVYFVVVFSLLYGAQLDEALRQEQEDEDGSHRP